jgi:putative flippase GtrA
MKFYRQAGLYYVVSAIAFAINLLIYGSLIYYCHVYYLFAAILGFVTQNVLDYAGERVWVFNETHIRPVVGYARSFGVALTILVFVLALTYVGFHILGLNYLFARIFAGIIAGLVNFILDKKITFVV